MRTDRYQDNTVFTATDGRGIGMLDAGDRRGYKNAYIDLLHKMGIEDLHRFSGNECVLEYGCGAGRIARWLGERSGRVLAADPDPHLLGIAGAVAARRNVVYVQIEPSGFPFPANAFDLVTCIGLLRLLTDQEAGSVLSSIKGVLKPGGRLICIDRAAPRERPGERTLEQLMRLFHAQGMSEVRSKPIRKGHWFALYLIQLGFIPRSWFERIARYELQNRPSRRRSSWDYYQYIFQYVKS